MSSVCQCDGQRLRRHGKAEVCFLDPSDEVQQILVQKLKFKPSAGLLLNLYYVAYCLRKDALIMHVSEGGVQARSHETEIGPQTEYCRSMFAARANLPDARYYTSRNKSQMELYGFRLAVDNCSCSARRQPYSKCVHNSRPIRCGAKILAAQRVRSPRCRLNGWRARVHKRLSAISLDVTSKSATCCVLL